MSFTRTARTLTTAALAAAALAAAASPATATKHTSVDSYMTKPCKLDTSPNYPSCGGTKKSRGKVAIKLRRAP